MSDAANAATGLDELVERVLPVVRDAVLADGASFLLLSDDGKELRIKGRVGCRGGGGRRHRDPARRRRIRADRAPPGGRS